MEKVRDEILEKMLKDYKPLYRFLKEAEYEPNLKVYGTFLVPKNWFFNGSGEFGHFADSERVFCFNQLAYVLFAEGFSRGHVPGVQQMPLEDVYRLQKEGTFLVESNNIRYKKQIISTQPFKGKLEVTNTFIKSKGGIVFLDIAYDFENGKATGENRVAIMLRDLETLLKADST